MSQINEKHGPFTCLLCTGRFYREKDREHDDNGGEDDEQEGQEGEHGRSANNISMDRQACGIMGADSVQSMHYLTGARSIPIPTYFIDSSSHSVMMTMMKREPNEQPLVHNLHFLGGYGVRNHFCGIEGLSIAFLGGSYDRYAYRSASLTLPDSNHYTQSIISHLEKQILQFRGENGGKQVDILLTCEWPAHILNCLPNNRTVTQHRKSIGSFSVTRIAQKAVPRYHFASMEGFFFERLPYQTKSLANTDGGHGGNQVHVTRFISLSKVKEEIEGVEQQKVDKFLYAMNMSLGENATSSVLPEGTTANPYDQSSVHENDQATNRKERDGRQTQQQQQQRERKHHGDTSSSSSTRGSRHNDRSENRSSTSNTDNCWFCLKNTKLETHLLVSIGDESYLAFPKGGLTDEHLLVIPLSHSAYFGQCTLATQLEMVRFLKAVKKMFEQDKKNVITFERNVSFNSRPVHMMLNVVAVSQEVDTETCKQRFLEDIAEKNGTSADQVTYQFYEASISTRDSISKFIAAHPKTDYLFVEFPDESKACYALTGSVKATATAGRSACRKILDLSEEKDDWRKCSEGKEKETEIVTAFKSKFSKYDFTL